MAACHDRSMLLAALRAEQTAHERIGWDNTLPVVFQFIRASSDGVAYPIGAIVSGCNVSEQLYAMAAMLHDSPHARDKVAKRQFHYIGVGVIFEAWLEPGMRLVKCHTEKIDARMIAGMSDEGYMFTVVRVRNEEPLAIPEDVQVSAESDLQDGLFALNQALLVAHGRPCITA
jgi:hypothetical protein